MPWWGWGLIAIGILFDAFIWSCCYVAGKADDMAERAGMRIDEE